MPRPTLTPLRWLRHSLPPLALVSLLLGTLCFWVTQPWVRPQPASDLPEISSERLALTVKRLSVDRYPRSADHPERLQQAADDIAAALRATGAEVEIQAVPVEESTNSNIVARFGPRDGPVRVIGAHYDSHGHAHEGAKHARGYSLATHTPGADDNASGVAALIELAHLLQQRPPRQAVELVAYTLEEPPHFRTAAMGSAHHARRLATSKRPVSWVLVLEMIGYFDERPGSQSYPLPLMSTLYPDRGNFIGLVGAMDHPLATRRLKSVLSGASDLPVVSINAPRLLPGIDFSDHASYWDEGFSAWMLTDTAFYRNPHYHQGTDTIDTLDFDRMAKVVRMVYALAVADGDGGARLP